MSCASLLLQDPLDRNLADARSVRTARCAAPHGRRRATAPEVLDLMNASRPAARHRVAISPRSSSW